MNFVQSFYNEAFPQGINSFGFNSETPQQQVSESKGPPPASKRAVRKLPIIKVTAEDLVDENNRECCICLEENKLNDKVVRLPCAHIFHPQCIYSWLEKSCSCPICRYELQTDDLDYEKGRKERMKLRKPRYARYELERMKIRDLSSLCSRINLPIIGITEKAELICAILESGRVDVISAPEPVEYKLSDLRGLGVGKLKRAMAEAGVFFDAKDVIEKEDMVAIFVNSGRVVLLAEDENDGMSLEEDGLNRETEDTYTPEHKRSRQIFFEESTSTENISPSLSSDNNMDIGDAIIDDNLVHRSAELDSMAPENNIYHQNTSFEQMDNRTDRFENNFVERDTRNESSPYQCGSSCNYSAFASRNIAGLRQMAQHLNVDISDCIEKKEMIDRLVSHVATTRS